MPMSETFEKRLVESMFTPGVEVPAGANPVTVKFWVRESWWDAPRVVQTWPSVRFEREANDYVNAEELELSGHLISGPVEDARAVLYHPETGEILAWMDIPPYTLRSRRSGKFKLDLKVST